MRAPITFTRQFLPVEAIRAMRDAIFLDPHYQRQGDLWSRRNQRLFIDSMLNGFLIPAMYWHQLDSSSEYFDGSHRYAVVDGRQRLETLFQFLDDDLGLTADNSLLGDPTVDLGGLTLTGIRDSVPWLYASFMRAELGVVLIQTEEVDLIEELFSRLNEGVPLSAAEKRNRGTILAPLVRDYTEDHPFFGHQLPFGNRRYRHYDLLAKFMRIEERGASEGRVPDLKKIDLDRLFQHLRSSETEDPARSEREAKALLDLVTTRLDALTGVFTSDDRYLSSVGMVTLYYAIARYLSDLGEDPLQREEVEHFETLRLSVKGRDDEEFSEDERAAVEFARYSQGPTTGSYLTARLRIFLRVERRLFDDEPAADDQD